MPDGESSILKKPALGAVIALSVFIFFEGLLWVLPPLVHREFAAESLDPALIASAAASFLSARVWLGVALVFALLTFRFFNFGQPGREAAIALGLFIIGVNLLVVFRTLQFPICLDDAYIDFRHARNLALHGSLDYNLGDPVMGFTSHLHLWILSLLGRTVGFEALPFWSQNFNILCDLFSYGLLFRLGRQLGLSALPSALGSVILAVSLYPVASTTNGKEASLLILLLLLLVFAIETKRLTLAAWAAILIFLTRPEGVVVAGVAGFWCLSTQGWRPLIKSWGLPLALAVVWYAVLFWHFDTIWPQGMVAKSVAFKHPTVTKNAVLILSFLADSFGVGTGGQRIVTTQSVAFLFLVIPLLLWRLSHTSGLRVYLASIILLSATFICLRVIMAPFLWYFAWYSLASALLIPFLYEKALNFCQRTGGFRTLLVAGMTAFVLIAPLSAYPHSQSPLLGFKFPYPFFQWDAVPQRLLIYERVAQRIKTESGATATVAVCEDGMFGFIYGGPILTLDGLAFRNIRDYYPLPESQYAMVNFAAAPKLVLDQQPDYVVTLDVFGRKALLLDQDFLREYALQESIPSTAFGSDNLCVYKHLPINGMPLSPAPIQK